jgi:hypothetical protein
MEWETLSRFAPLFNQPIPVPLCFMLFMTISFGNLAMKVFLWEEEERIEIELRGERREREGGERDGDRGRGRGEESRDSREREEEKDIVGREEETAGERDVWQENMKREKKFIIF